MTKAESVTAKARSLSGHTFGAVDGGRGEEALVRRAHLGFEGKTRRAGFPLHSALRCVGL